MNSIKIKDLIIGKDTPKIAVPITGGTEEEIMAIVERIDKEKVDLVEWRADFFRDVLDIKRVLEVLISLQERLTNIPIIFTFRTRAEGGEREIPIGYYTELIKKVAASKMVDIIDIEIFSVDQGVEDLIDKVHKEDVFVIGSNHDFSKTPSEDEMIHILKSIEEAGADILKLAVMPKTSEDVLRLLNISNEMKKYVKSPVVTMSMGELGIISRISGKIFASSITFGALDRVSAPGQIYVDKLFDLLNLI